MNVVVTVEQRFKRLPDGSVWTDGACAYSFWTRYLKVFDGLKVLARVQHVASVPPTYVSASGPGVSFVDVPYYIGPWQFARKALQVHRAVRRAVTGDDAVILRVSSHIAGCLVPVLARSHRPYGLEVVGDPFDVFSPGAVRHWARGFFRWWFTRQLRGQCLHAAGVAYVTRYALQARYPCAAYSVGMSDVEIPNDAIVVSDDVLITHYSSVELHNEDAVTKCRPAPEKKRFRLVMVGSLAQMYKAPDVLIRAVSQCIRSGMDISLAIVGDGKHRRELERMVAALHLEDRIEFIGQLPAGRAVRAQLDTADLFVLPSRCEALPRAMVEAMARGLPCIGSSVGGIPELLPVEDRVPPDDVAALAAKIREVLQSPARMARMSVRNLAVAREYRDDVLDGRRRAFFEHIRRCTAQWYEVAERVASTTPCSAVRGAES